MNAYKPNYTDTKHTVADMADFLTAAGFKDLGYEQNRYLTFTRDYEDDEIEVYFDFDPFMHIDETDEIVAEEMEYPYYVVVRYGSHTDYCADFDELREALSQPVRDLIADTVFAKENVEYFGSDILNDIFDATDATWLHLLASLAKDVAELRSQYQGIYVPVKKNN